MKKFVKPIMIVLVALTTCVSCGCSKRFTKKTKLAGAAVVATVLAGAHYFGNVFGLAHKKCKTLTPDACDECKETEEVVDVLEDVLEGK